MPTTSLKSQKAISKHPRSRKRNQRRVHQLMIITSLKIRLEILEKSLFQSMHLTTCATARTNGLDPKSLRNPSAIASGLTHPSDPFHLPRSLQKYLRARNRRTSQIEKASNTKSTLQKSLYHRVPLPRIVVTETLMIHGGRGSPRPEKVASSAVQTAANRDQLSQQELQVMMKRNPERRRRNQEAVLEMIMTIQDQ